MYEQINNQKELKGKKLLNEEKKFYKDIILIKMKITTKSFLVGKIFSAINFWFLLLVSMFMLLFLIFGWKKEHILIANFDIDSVSIINQVHMFIWKIIEKLATILKIDPWKTVFFFPVVIPCIFWFSYILVNIFKTSTTKEYKFYKTNIIYCFFYIFANILSIFGIMFGLVAGIIFLINYFKQNKLLKERLMNVPKNSKNNISDIKKVNEHNKHLNSSFKSQTRKIIIDEKNHSRIVKMPTKKIKVDIEEKKGKK